MGYKRKKKRLAARLRIPVQIIEPPPDTDNPWTDSAGPSVLIDETRAEIWDEKGAESVVSMADADRITHHARVVFDSRINSSCRVKNLINNITYQIVFMTDIDFKNHEIIMDLRQL